MKGLLKKEFYITMKSFRIHLLMCIVFLVLGAWSETSFFVLIYPAILCGMIPVSILNFDEKTGWDRYSLCFPLPRSQVVGCKYLVSLILSAAICVVYVLIWGCTMLITKNSVELMPALSVYLPTLFTVALLPPAILLPCVFKLGSQKGSYAYYTVIALMAALIGVLNVSDVSGNQIEAALSFLAPSPFSILLLPLAAAILFFLSWPLSARIYEKKDF